MRGCWSCGAHGPCFDPCYCARCVDPDGYDEWRNDDPEAYDSWLESQEDDSDCDCPTCSGDTGEVLFKQPSRYHPRLKLEKIGPTKYRWERIG